MVAIACLTVCSIILKKLEKNDGSISGNDAAINFSTQQRVDEEQPTQNQSTTDSTQTQNTASQEQQQEESIKEENQTQNTATETDQSKIPTIEKTEVTDLGLILDQKEYGDVDFGAFGNVADNGCGAVAIYNILKLDQKDVELTSIINELGAAKILWGVAGTAPTGITKYFKSKGYETKIVANKNNFESTLKKYKYGIYCYWTVTGGHYEVIYDYNNNDGKWQILNPTYRSSIGDLNEQYKWYVKFLICVK